MELASFRLIVREGPSPGTTFDLTKEITLFGRDVVNDIVIGDTEISRKHARLMRTPGGFVLEDLGSTNGTFVNDERLSAPRVLSIGDLIGLGGKVKLTFDAVSPEIAATVVGASASAPPPAAPSPAPTPPPARPAAAAPAPAYAPVAPVEEKKKKSPWLMAGCGCLLLLIVLIGVFWFMDSYYPNILYAPLEMFGF